MVVAQGHKRAEAEWFKRTLSAPQAGGDSPTTASLFAERLLGKSSRQESKENHEVVLEDRKTRWN